MGTIAYIAGLLGGAVLFALFLSCAARLARRFNNFLLYGNAAGKPQPPAEEKNGDEAPFST